MGKEKKVRRHQSLSQQILEGNTPRVKAQKARCKGKLGGEHETSQDYVEGRLSRKILEQARLQQEELEEEFGLVHPSEGIAGAKKRRRGKSGPGGKDFV